jgi:spore photoproduct lyase
LAKGSLASQERREFVERIHSLYPDAQRVLALDTSHNRFDLATNDSVERHTRGKRTLVFGELKTAVRFSEEEGNTCPNYWHFSPYGYCPFGCKYCYLSGTQGVWHSPTVKVYVNLPEMLDRIDRTARRLGRPTAFYVGKLQDGLALDPLTGYSRLLVPFFADHPFARQILLTKSDAVDNLLPLRHGGRTILSWSLNPPEVAGAFEENTPTVAERIVAMRRCAAAGYPLRAVLMPIVPVPGWREIYERFLADLIVTVPLDRLTLGGICIYRNARALMERRLGSDNSISRAIGPARSEDGRARYGAEQRVAIYRHLLEVVRSTRPDLDVALCLEEPDVWRAVGLTDSIGRCNCVL